jgi:hypothetical protein
MTHLPRTAAAFLTIADPKTPYNWLLTCRLAFIKRIINNQRGQGYHPDVLAL